MEQIKKVSHREHILVRPDSYVGSTTLTKDIHWIIENGTFKKQTLEISPALMKIFDEILVNAIDRNSVFPKEVKMISVSMTENGSITVENTGPLGGISVEMHPTEKVWNPELTFGHLLTSTNYDDSKDRIVGGRNGYGAKLANVYSSRFEITIKDGANKKQYNQTWVDNMSACHPPIITSYGRVTNSVSITFLPDWKRFGMTGPTNDLLKIIEKRVWDAAFFTKGCKVSWQGGTLPNLTTASYFKMYCENECIVINSDRWQVAMAVSNDGFQQISLVNGICTTKGGTHVDHVVNMATAGMVDKTSLKPYQVKNSIFVLVKAVLVNPTFSSQVKDECTSKVSTFGSKFDPPKTFIKNLLKIGFQDEIALLSKVKQMKDLKKTDGNSLKSRITGIPKLDDANWAGTAKSHNCTLILTEGDSAKALAVAGLSIVGRDKFGVFPLRGKPRNVRDASTAQILANAEFNNIKKIIGLKQGMVYTDLRMLRYGSLMIMADADHDGSHIKGLVINMIHYFWPSLIDLGFVVSMITPIIKVTKGSQFKWFFTEGAFKKWYATSSGKWNIKYYKGLGTSTSAEAKEYFKSIEKLTIKFTMDDVSNNAVQLAFEKVKTDERKRWLTNVSENDPSTLEVNYGNIKALTVNEFIHKDMVHFSLADLRRSIPNMMDGLKPSQRKVIYAALKRRLTTDIKVAQFAAYVAESTAYHHGEVSLADTIVRLAHDFTGSNNINLLYPSGQFGTRLQGGKDASQTRYIFTRLMPETRKLFDERDDDLLTYIEDEGKLVEPEYFAPIIPLVLVNGCEGIGTGFSCSIPPYNPDDIKNNIKRCFLGEDMIPMKPWYKGFKGCIVKEGDTWVAQGVSAISGSTITITELPPGLWTDSYKEYLDGLIEKKIISGYVNNSTTDDVHFKVSDYTGQDMLKDFKLCKNIHTTNMHLFHPTKGIKKYSSPEEIIVDYLSIRMDLYALRKHHLVKTLSAKVEELRNKAKFIQMVCSGDLVVFRRKMCDITKDLDRYKFQKIDDSFNYLLNIKTYEYTDESIDELKKKATVANRELDDIQKMSAVDMWEKDLM